MVEGIAPQVADSRGGLVPHRPDPFGVLLLLVVPPAAHLGGRAGLVAVPGPRGDGSTPLFLSPTQICSQGQLLLPATTPGPAGDQPGSSAPSLAMAAPSGRAPLPARPHTERWDF